MSSASSLRMASRNCREGTSFSALLEKLGDEAGPAGLMTGAKAGAVVAMEVFIKQNQVAPMRITLKEFCAAGDRAAAGAIAQKDMYQAAGNLRRDLPEV